MPTNELTEVEAKRQQQFTMRGILARAMHDEAKSWENPLDFYMLLYSCLGDYLRLGLVPGSCDFAARVVNAEWGVPAGPERKILVCAFLENHVLPNIRQLFENELR